MGVRGDMVAGAWGTIAAGAAMGVGGEIDGSAGVARVAAGRV